MKAFNLGKRITSVLLCATLAGGLFAGCKKGDDMFPSIVSPNEQNGESESITETVDPATESEIRRLKVALPYSDLTIQCLASMLYCKNNGKWDSSESGLTIDTDYLSSVATNYVVSNTGCGMTGAGLETIKLWGNGRNMPDLFLASDSNAVWEAGYAGELNDYLADSAYLDSQQIYAAALAEDSRNGVFYAVPHFCSAEILIGNAEYIPASTGKLQTKCTTAELGDYVKEIKKANPSVAGIASAYELIPYLGSAFNGDAPTSYMLCDEYAKDAESSKVIIDAAASYVRDLYSDSLAFDLIEGKDPVYAKSAGLWIDSSANIMTWSDYYSDNLYLLHIPCDDAANIGVPYVSTYSLCVSANSENSEFAAEFAAFISFDPDAQLLIYRLENMSGLMPVTRNEAVWDLISEDKLFGHMASDFRQTMDNAVYCPCSYDNKIYSNTNEYTAEFVKGTGAFNPEKCYG